MESMATAVSGGGGGLGYTESVDSSPRSRGGDSWDEPFPSSAADMRASRLRLMCSYGGRIVPRSTDKSLCYLNGETRIVVVDRHCSLSDFTAKLSRSLLGGRPFTLKYQLPNEDLDSLISVSTDEDLENMIEEYDRLLASAGAAAASGGGAGSVGGGGGSTRSSRLRLFLFPAKSESVPSSTIGSLLDDSKSETWFVDALNSAIGGLGIDGLPRGFSADAASVNCLLGLEDDASVHSRGRAAINVAGVGHTEPEQLVLPRPDSSGKLARPGQDVQSVPDSPMLDTTSSFGSASSAPCLSNLPPIFVHQDDRPPDHRIAGLDDHFAHMNLSSAVGQRMDEGVKEQAYAPQHQPPPIPLPTASASTPNISPTTPNFSPTENSSRVFSSDDEKSDHGGIRKPPQLPKPTQIDAPIPDSVSRPVYMNANSDQKRELSVASDPSYRVPMPIADAAAGYVLPSVQPEQLHQQQPHPHLHQQQQQYIPANPPHYIHHPATGAVVPVPSYYHPIAAHSIPQSQQAHSYDPQIPTMYYLPVRQTSPYNLTAMQPASLADPISMQPIPRVAAKAELPTSLYKTAVPAPSSILPPPLIHVTPDQVHTYAGIGYHMMQQQHLSQSPATYGYDPKHPPLYYSQATSPPTLAPQYQTVSSGTVTVDATAAGESKTFRAL